MALAYERRHLAYPTAYHRRSDGLPNSGGAPPVGEDFLLLEDDPGDGSSRLLLEDDPGDGSSALKLESST